MKRWTTLLIVLCMLGITIPAMGAMSISKMTVSYTHLDVYKRQSSV